MEANLGARAHRLAKDFFLVAKRSCKPLRSRTRNTKADAAGTETKNEGRTMETAKMDNLLSKISQVPKSTVGSPTFLEVCGYPHYENVASNVLEFYFSAGREHKLGTFLLSCLLSAARVDVSDDDLLDASGSREEPTDSRKRLDLVIDCSNVVVGVENKIGAGVYNPFRAYSDMLEKRAEGRKVIKILLVLNKVEGPVNAGFKPVTYEDFFNIVLARLGQQLFAADGKWLSYLIDFIKTTQNLTRRLDMSSEFLDLVRTHREELLEVKESLDRFKNEVGAKLRQLSAQVDVEAIGTNVTPGRQYWGEWWSQKLAGVDYYEIEVSPDLKIAIDAVLSADGYRFDIFQRSGPDPNLTVFLSGCGIDTRPSPDFPQDGRVMDTVTFQYNDESSKVASRLAEIISRIAKAPETAV